MQSPGTTGGGRPGDGPGPALELPPEILRTLARFRRRVRAVRALRGLGITLLVSTALFAAAILLDRNLVLSPEARLLLTGGAFGGAVLSALVFLAVPLLRPLSARRAARGLEA